MLALAMLPVPPPEEPPMPEPPKSEARDTLLDLGPAELDTPEVPAPPNRRAKTPSSAAPRRPHALDHKTR